MKEIHLTEMPEMIDLEGKKRYYIQDNSIL